MSEIEERAESIIKSINEHTADLTPNERAMVLLFVTKMAQVVVELDMAETYKPRKVGA